MPRFLFNLSSYPPLVVYLQRAGQIIPLLNIKKLEEPTTRSGITGANAVSSSNDHSLSHCSLVVLMLAALAAIGGYAVKQTRNSAREVHQVTQGVVPTALASAEIASQVRDVQIATMTAQNTEQKPLVVQGARVTNIST